MMRAFMFYCSGHWTLQNGSKTLPTIFFFLKSTHYISMSLVISQDIQQSLSKPQRKSERQLKSLGGTQGGIFLVHSELFQFYLDLIQENCLPFNV